MSDFKTMLQSKTVWGGIIILLSWGVAAGGYVVSEADQKTLVDIAAGIASTEHGAAAIAMAVANAAGAVLAIYGRIKATKLIRK